MAQAVTVYRWDDPGAPQIVDGKPSEYLDVLKKCLIDGYGTKSPAGWAIAEESQAEEAPFLALTNGVGGGSGGTMMFRASDDNATTVLMCQSALDYLGKDSSSRLGTYFVFGSHSTSSSLKIKNWMVIASNTACYIFGYADNRATENNFGTNAGLLLFFGDIKSAYPNDAAIFVSLYGSHNNTVFSWNSGFHYVLGSSVGSKVGIVYALDGSENFSDSYISTFFNSFSGSTSSLDGQEPTIRVMSPVAIVSGDADLNGSGTRANSLTDPYFRGFVPGLFVSQEIGFKNRSMPFINQIDGQQYFNIPSAHTNPSRAWVNIEEW